MNPLSVVYDMTLGMVDREDARRGKLAVEAKRAEVLAYVKEHPLNKEMTRTTSRWKNIL